MQPSGYPKLAAAINCDPNFMIYRRFGYMRNRMLLYHQEGLALLERELDQLDAEDEAVDKRFLGSRARDESRKEPRRRRLFHRINEEMHIYGNISRGLKIHV